MYIVIIINLNDPACKLVTLSFPGEENTNTEYKQFSVRVTLLPHCPCVDPGNI